MQTNIHYRVEQESQAIGQCERKRFQLFHRVVYWYV